MMVGMAYTTPTFNLLAGIFSNGANVALDPPRVVTLANLAWGRRVNVVSTGGTSTAGVFVQAMEILLPPLTDIRGPQSPSLPDAVEVPLGSGRVYDVTFVDDIGKGFANEHRAATLRQRQGWPEPIP